MRVVDHVPNKYHYALGDATNAYSRDKLMAFTRELVYIPTNNLLIVFDRVVSTDPSFHKAWLLHGVNEPTVNQDTGNPSQGTQQFPQAKTFRFTEGSGELLVHALLPEKRVIIRRGGNNNEFYAPGGQNWPLENPAGEPLPDDQKLRRMWKLFWGEEFDRILPSNRKNVVPGAWRIEVSPSEAAQEDLFLHVLEIGDKGATGKNRVELLDGASLKGAAYERGPLVLFSATGSPVASGEVSLPDINCTSLIVTGLHPEVMYELNLNGLNVPSPGATILPGVSAGVIRQRANGKGVLRVERSDLKSLRLRLARVEDKLGQGQT
jgi:heparin/heparan-sulfate lyase